MNHLFIKWNFSLFGLTLLLVTFLSQQMEGQCRYFAHRRLQYSPT